MANPNPGPLSKWLFIITMVGALAYIGSAFVFVILPSDTDSPATEAPAVTEKTADESKNKPPAAAAEPSKGGDAK